MKGDRLAGAIQESLLALLCFDGTEGGAQFVRALVPLRLYDPYFKEIAEEADLYIEKYGQPPGDHTFDIVNALKERKPDKADQFAQVYSSLLRTKDLINRHYVINQARSFVRRQSIRATIQKITPIVFKNNVTDTQLDEVEALVSNLTKQSLELESPGLLLNDPAQALAFMDEEDKDTLPLGIKELDDVQAGPLKGGHWLFLAGTNKGKSQIAAHIGKMGMIYGWNVLHISLEMSENQVAQRYVQSIASVSKREAKVLVTRHFKTDDLGRFTGFDEIELKRPSLKDEKIRAYLKKKILPLKNRARVVIKRFPTGQLTIKGLKAYLDRLASVMNFLPDVLILDYPDLMDKDPKHVRECLGKIHEDLRGIAVERNLASVVFSQTNRLGQLSKNVDLTKIGEDFSKAQTADIVVTYSQTDAEYELGLARLGLAKHRHDVKGFQVLISQAYSLCQFVIDSSRMVESNYWGQVDKKDPEEDEDAEEAPKPKFKKRIRE